MDTLGYYGKLPSFGDFVTKRLPVSFVEPWDAWLSRCIVDSQRMLGERWLDIYLTSPIWRFALTSGVCGDSAYLGVLLPSLDAVERCYPFAMAGALAPDVSVIDHAMAVEGWYEELEQVALTALDEDEFDESEIEERLGKLADQVCTDVARPVLLTDAGEGPFVAEVPAGMDWPDAMRKSLEQVRFGDGRRLSAWWTDGSPEVPATMVLEAGLPSPRCFMSMLSGTWSGPSPAAKEASA